MYTSFFGFKENPFNLTPDPRFLFLSRYHKEALDHLLYGVNERKGFVSITGGIGTGKTTLCRAFLTHLDRRTKSALIFNAFLSDIELLRSINKEFGIQMPLGAESKTDYIDALNRFLLENFSTGGNAVLLIDEAQNLSRSVLEQIRMLSNLETEKEKLIQIILVGQPELKELLVSPGLRQLDERITVRYDLKPLDSGDIKGYVEHRLLVAGSRGNLRFTRGALKKVFSYSKGNPRRINAVCDRALLIAYALEKQTVSGRMLNKAISEIHCKMRTDSLLKGRNGKRLALAGSLAVLLSGALAFGAWTLRKPMSRFFLSRITSPFSTAIPVPREPLRPEKKAASLFLDEQTGFSGLSRIFNENIPAGGMFDENEYPELFSITIGPQYCEMFRRPFIVRLSAALTADIPSARYLLVRRLTDDGAIVVDADGRDNPVDKSFVIRNWGNRISWIFPCNDRETRPEKGMSSPDIREIQQMLRQTGYAVEPTGLFDERTFHELVKFQKDFGLPADGIIDPRTRALLYLMS